ncbi:MAG: hypothetical protein H6631_11435 [Anaerolineaceae bacterium]|nr:hypothetical protein [Anaerolineaceae bacterium]MCB9102581.1 hypothetical protein [Anaerolineales bacterium]
MQKQNLYINHRWLALMHGLFINPITINRGGETALTYDPFDLELVKNSRPNLVGRWQVSANGQLTRSYK